MSDTSRRSEVSAPGRAQRALKSLLGRSGRSPRPGHESWCEALESRQLLAGDLLSGGFVGPTSGEATTDNAANSVMALPDMRIGKVRWGNTIADAIAGQYVLGLNEAATDETARSTVYQLASRLGIEVRNLQVIPGGRYVQFDTSARPTKPQVDAASRDLPLIAALQPNTVYKPARVPNDPQFTQQYWLQNTGQPIVPQTNFVGTAGADINVTEAWDISVGSKDTVVAVIDSGVQLDHPDLAANIYRNPNEIPGNGIDDDANGFVDDVNGWDFGDLDNNPYDDAAPSWFGHGTGVAGMIGAVGNNGIGVSGVNWDVSILPMKIAFNQFFEEFNFVFSTTSFAALAGAYDYITMMANRGVNIVAANASYGLLASDFYEDEVANPEFVLERQAIERMIAAGVTFVAAAGNDANDNDADLSSYPATYDIPGLISVAATDFNDNIASYSNFGAESVDLGAPGLFVWDTEVGSGYGFFGGTSAASPVVAGAVALLRSVRPDASAVEVRNALISTTDPIPDLQGRTVSGGRLNVARALQALSVGGPVIRAVSPGPIALQIDQNQTPALPIDTIRIEFNKAINPALLATSNFRLLGSGTDASFDTSDDVVVPISAVAVENSNTVVLTLNLSGFVGQRLRIDSYRLTLRHNLSASEQIRDTEGNFLNGNALAGQDENYNFRIVNLSGDNEPNDTLSTATPIPFTASGSASFNGVSLGNGLAGPLDVDIYQVTIPRGGQLTVEITAARRAAGSTLDSYLRLFNAAGDQIAFNDQYFGSDSYLSFYLTTGGTYYVGVSGFGNSLYNPRTQSSGNAQSTGIYDLRVGVTLAADDRISYDSNIPAQGLRIPFDPASVATLGQTTATLTSTDTRQILDVNVRLTLTHQFDADLRISLRSPSGRTVILSDRRGGAGQNFTSTLFDDESTATIAGGTAPFTGTFKPDEPLSGFDGLSALGVWTLIIDDTTSLSVGSLLAFGIDFTLSNDIFGPFESNNTLTTASALTGVNGSGIATISAFIGDGGFGTRDRDIFSFTAVTGSSLTARVTSGTLNQQGDGINVAGASLNSALRLFDASGNELNLSNPSGTRNSAIENFVFTEGGTYYLAVSDSANVGYQPNDINSGAASLTTGNFVLEIALAAGVSDPAVVVAGQSLALGLGTSSTLFAPNTSGGFTGLRYNGTEFLFEASADSPVANSFFAGVAGGSTFRNSSNAAAGTGIPFSLADQSDSSNRRVVTRSNFITGQGSLQIERNFSYGINDSFVAIDVYLTNAATQTITGVQWLEAFNPEQGINLSPSSQNTANDLSGVDAGGRPRLAVASYATNAFPGGLSIGLAAPLNAAFSPRANIVLDTVLVRDPQQVRALPTNDPNGLESDSLLAMTFDLGSIAAGATQHLRYYILLGNSAAAISEQYALLNSTSASGHLAPDPAAPASETLTQPDNSSVNLPLLPYRVYYPEGFANAQTYTFVPIVNQTAHANRVSVIARYEFDAANPLARRDQVIADFELEAGQRGGITITTPELYAANTLLVDKDRPYAIEIRSEAPVAATFSHYDLFLLAGGRAAIGQAFTTRVSTSWNFASVTKGSGVSDFLLFMNTTGQTAKVTATFYRQTNSSTSAAGAPISVTQEIGPYRRAGFNVSQDFGSLIPAGNYGVSITSDVSLVASLSHYQTASTSLPAGAYGYVGVPGTGSAGGVLPEGQSGLNATDERLVVLNTTAAASTVTFTFVFTGGSTFRSVLTVPANSQRSLTVQEIPNFPLGQPYGVRYSSTTPVTIVQPSQAFSNGLANSFADRAFSLWGFGEGFRPANNATNVREYLRLYNPSNTDTLAEITIRFDNDLGTEVTNWTVPARGLIEIDIHQLVTGSRLTLNAFYGLSIKAATPIVAYMGHFDPFFPGAFGTLGTPAGQSIAIT